MASPDGRSQCRGNDATAALIPRDGARYALPAPNSAPSPRASTSVAGRQQAGWDRDQREREQRPCGRSRSRPAARTACRAAVVVESGAAGYDRAAGRDHDASQRQQPVVQPPGPWAGKNQHRRERAGGCAGIDREARVRRASRQAHRQPHRRRCHRIGGDAATFDQYAGQSQHEPVRRRRGPAGAAEHDGLVSGSPVASPAEGHEAGAAERERRRWHRATRAANQQRRKSRASAAMAPVTYVFTSPMIGAPGPRRTLVLAERMHS